MGLDAHVACNCYRDGLASEPPVPRAQITIDEYGDVLPVDDFHNWPAFDDWLETACPHERMQAAGEWIGNMSGVSWLRSMAEALPRARFARLAEILSHLSGMMDSHLPVADAQRALPELDALLEQDLVGSTRIVCGDETVINNDVDRGHIDYHEFKVLSPYSGYPSPWPDLVELGLHGYEFVVRARGKGRRELLRARLLRQEWDQSGADYDADSRGTPASLVTFTNIENGDSIRVRSFGLAGKIRLPDEMTPNRNVDSDGSLRHYPTTLFVSERKRMIAEYWWTLSKLRSLFAASIATGNPVVWG